MSMGVSKFEKLSSFISKTDKRITEEAETAKTTKQSIPCKFHGRSLRTKGENCPYAHVDIAANNVSKGKDKSKGKGLPKPNFFGPIAMTNHGWKPVILEKQAPPPPPISSTASAPNVSAPNVPSDHTSAKGMRVDEGAVEASAKGTRVLGDTGDTSAKGTRAVDIIVSTPSPRVKFDMGVDATPKNPKKFPIETTVAATIEACVPDCACAI
jgi:hypothetical protein